MPLFEATILTIFIIFLFIGLFSIIFGFPGTFLILGDIILYAWITGFEKIGFKIIIVLVFISLLAETIDFFMVIAGAKKYGSSKKGVILSIIGGIIGAILMATVLLGLGAIIGAFFGGFVGAFLGEYLEQKKFKEAVRAGYGSLIGRIIGILIKGSLAIVMVITALSAIYS